MIRKLFLCAICIACLLGSWGCRSGIPIEDQGGMSCVIIAGRHANATMYTKEDLHDYLRERIPMCTTYTRSSEDGLIYGEVDLTVILCDGKPAIVPLQYGEEIFPLTFTVETTGELEQTLTDYVYVVEQMLLAESFRANDEESDLCKAISIAAEVFEEKPNKDHALLLLDTGIVSTGAMCMKNVDIQTGTVESAIGRLPGNAFCNLNDVKIRMVGLGNTATGQKDMRDDEVFCRRLEDFWTAYFHACGGILEEKLCYTSKLGRPMVHAEEEEDSYPRVSNVPFLPSYLVPPDEPITITGTENTRDPVDTEPPVKVVTPVKPEGVLVFNALELDFKDGLSDFRDETAAMEALKGYEPIFLWLKEHPEVRVYVVGSIAKVTPETYQSTCSVSRERAQKVRHLIIKQYGLPLDQVVYKDAGTRELFWREGVEFPDGTMNSRDLDAMQKNRIVAIIPDIPGDVELEKYINELIAEGLLTQEERG